MLITFPRYYFRYTIESKIFNSTVWHTRYPGIDKPILIGVIQSYEARNLLDVERTVIEWAPHTKHNQTRVKPQNVLFVHRPHTPADIHKLMCDLPWELDLRTVDLNSYPEYFI